MSTIRGLIETLEKRLADNEARITALEHKHESFAETTAGVVSHVMAATQMLVCALEDPKQTDAHVKAARGILQGIIDALHAAVAPDAPATVPAPPAPDTSAFVASDG